MLVSKVTATRRGFTLVELMVVVGILGVLMGLALPAVMRIREAAAQTECRNNLRQIGIALQGFQNVKGSLPPGYLCDENYIPPEGIFINAFPGWSWAAHLLNQLDYGNLAAEIKWNLAVEDSANAPQRATIIKTFVCPSDFHTGVYTALNQLNKPLADVATNSYAANYGYGGRIGEYPNSGNGVFYRNSKTRTADIRDGLATTIAIGERGSFVAQGPWAGAMCDGTIRTHPDYNGYVAAIEEAPVMVLAHTSPWTLSPDYADLYDFLAAHPSIGNFLFADGSVRGLAANKSQDFWQALGTRAGKETVSESDF